MAVYKLQVESSLRDRGARASKEGRKGGKEEEKKRKRIGLNKVDRKWKKRAKKGKGGAKEKKGKKETLLLVRKAQI